MQTNLIYNVPKGLIITLQDSNIFSFDYCFYCSQNNSCGFFLGGGGLLIEFSYKQYKTRNRLPEGA